SSSRIGRAAAGPVAAGGPPVRGDRRRPAGVAAREVTVAGDGVVEGTLVDEDGQPVVEGRISLWCLSPDGTVARIRDGELGVDEEGRFSGPACRGQVCPRLTHPSRIADGEWSLRPGRSAVLPTRMLPRLWGQVVDPQGEPVAGAQVVLGRSPDDDDPEAVLPVMTTRTSTDADGLFSVPMIDRPACDACMRVEGTCYEDEPLPVLDRVLVTARAKGWAPGSVEVEVDPQVARGADEPTPFELRLRTAEAAIVGTLVDANGRPLPRALVLARSHMRPHEQHRSEADDGVFGFESLAEGSYELRAIQDGVELLRRADIEPGSTVDLRLPHAQRDVVLRLLDESGRPREGITVEGGPFERQSSDAEGRVRAQRVMPGVYILRLRPPRGRARAWDLEVLEAPASGPTPEIALTVPTESEQDPR
ncbi:MAG: carboxypeptidase-like regulatory domain-containing protein, partial [Nannocystaceae bacterium]